MKRSNIIIGFSLSAMVFSVSSLFYWYKHFNKPASTGNYTVLNTKKEENIVKDNPDTNKKEKENSIVATEPKNLSVSKVIEKKEFEKEIAKVEQTSKNDKENVKDFKNDKPKQTEQIQLAKKDADTESRKTNQPTQPQKEKNIEGKNKEEKENTKQPIQPQKENNSNKGEISDIDDKNLSVVCVAGEKCKLYYNLREYNIGDTFSGYKIKDIFIDEVLLEKDGKIRKINIR